MLQKPSVAELCFPSRADLGNRDVERLQREKKKKRGLQICAAILYENKTLSIVDLTAAGED